MRIRAVIDLKQGQVVLGKGGNRTLYKPVQSLLANSANPIDIAVGFRNRLGIDRLYLADLDAIEGGIPDLLIYDQLADIGMDLWIDAGVKQAGDAHQFSQVGKVVAGLETLAGPDQLRDLQRCLKDRLIFSLDLRHGVPLNWGGFPEDIARMAINLGVQNILVIDLSRVGTGGGIGTEELCRLLIREKAGLNLSVGGGIRCMEDLDRLRQIGVKEVLVASALHNGMIVREDLASFH